MSNTQAEVAAGRWAAIERDDDGYLPDPFEVFQTLDRQAEHIGFLVAGREFSDLGQGHLDPTEIWHFADGSRLFLSNPCQVCFPMTWTGDRKEVPR